MADYTQLVQYHYRQTSLGPYCKIFVIKSERTSGLLRNQIVGVIVYTMPVPSLQLRSVFFNGQLENLSAKDRLQFVNKNIRTISRVVIEPRFRGLGIASWLVSQTMPAINVPVIESLAVMGHINPFFEKAGMKAIAAPQPARCVQLIEAFSSIGLEKGNLIDPANVQRKLELLPKQQSGFIEQQMKLFLQSYGKRRNMPANLERTKYVLSKLTDRPVYYVWFNPCHSERSEESLSPRKPDPSFR
jgi:hypothetical protein